MNNIDHSANAAKGDWRAEIDSGQRFEFGHNWRLFLEELDDRRIVMAERSLLEMLEVETLEGLSFLDAGSGSGLFSLAARRLGAVVYSFDFDPNSVACTQELRRRYFPDDNHWTVEQGSVLDEAYLASLPRFDIVYSWGVLHHTGDMWSALANVAPRVADGGKLYIAIYNDQGWASKAWTGVKRAYVSAPGALKWAVLLPATLRLWGPASVRDLLQGRPFHSWRSYAEKRSRGMHPWRDVVDWVGGYPFEVATPDQLFDFYAKREFALTKMITVGGKLGCNELVFKKATGSESIPAV